MIAQGIKFETYKHEWMEEGPSACGHAYLDDDVAMGIWLMASYREHAHADMSEYAKAVEEAAQAWSDSGADADAADAVSFEHLESLKERMEEWIEDEEKYGRDYDPEDIEIAEKREWLEAVSERLARRKR